MEDMTTSIVAIFYKLYYFFIMNNKFNMNSNANQMNFSNDELYIKYEEIFRNILISLIDDNQETDSSTRLEKILVEFDKVIDEECLNRIKNTYLLNAQIISNFKQKNNISEIPVRETANIRYDDLISKYKASLSEFNINR
jgi:hypothetical protein